MSRERTCQQRETRRRAESGRKETASANEIPLHLRKASPDLDWKTRFRIIAAKASRNNKNPLSYSATEAPIRAELVKMGFVEGESFLHQHRVFGYLGRKGQKVYYWLDFYLPDLKLGLEADGEVWHNFFDLKERDRNRDTILSKTQGVKVVRFSSYDLRKKRLERKLSRVIQRRAMEGRVGGKREKMLWDYHAHQGPKGGK